MEPVREIKEEFVDAKKGELGKLGRIKGKVCFSESRDIVWFLFSS